MLIIGLMVVLFVSGKFPYGLVTMTCCALLCLTGIMDAPTAFSGLSNKMVILIAPMFVLGAAFSKTNLTNTIRKWMMAMNGKKGIVLVAIMYLITIVMVQFASVTVTLTIMITFIAALGNEGDVTPSKIMMPLLMVTCGFTCLTPIGMGATNFAMDNSLISGIVPEQYLFTLWDFCKVGSIPAVAVLIYGLFIWKFIPESKVDSSKMGPAKEFVCPYTKAQEMLVYALFFGVFVVIMFFSQYMYIAPAVAVLILAYTKIMDTKEIIAIMTGDMIWMIAGVLVVASAMANSGAGDLIGNAILNVLGGSQNGIFVMLVFAVVTVVMTTFMSNAGTYMIMMPVAASVAMAGGYDPRSLCIIVTLASNYAFAFPTGSNQAALTYATAGYNPVKIAKYTLPGLAIMIAALVLSANFWFPLAG